ncbi:MAG TPA: hypothetical protein VGW36_05835 [Pyrinomonadaceae bacterium]|nr:hypothetical protein [Pyrinomonadaceae bacterium]
MKHHPAWLAAGLLLAVLLACNLGKKSENVNTNTGGNRNTPAAEEADLGSGNAIREIHMAKDNGRGAPGDETNSFSPDDHTVHCVVKLKEAKSGTNMRFSWWIVDADGSKNQKIKDIDYTTRTLENIVHGHLSLPQDWPQGKYKVQVYVNGDLDRTAFYSVQ